jgi:hypothetical protein
MIPELIICIAFATVPATVLLLAVRAISKGYGR